MQSRSEPEIEDEDEAAPWTQVADEQTGEIRVLEDECTTCIFRPDSPFHHGQPGGVQSGRIARMTQEAIQNQGHIVCHNTIGTEKGAICRGFADRWGKHSLAIRLGTALGTLTEVPDPKEDTSDLTDSTRD
ncbi:hypothetical protein ACFU99_00830 [Streptomyces sp. NPDC057654]|uniref:hypothetical protein n=1 Tax=Streptomyces sp. NPDC057654 TaxID=3346196 RepID=UPI0036AEF293